MYELNLDWSGKMDKFKQLILTVFLICFFNSSPSFAAWQPEVAFGGAYLYTHNSGELWEDDYSLLPDIQFNIFRELDENWKFGTGVSLLINDLSFKEDSRNVLQLRLANFNYQLSQDVSTGVFFTVGKYFRKYPSFGYGVGFNGDYKLSADWKLSLDVNWLGVDSSGSVPQDAGITNKDTLIWSSLLVKYSF